MHRQAARVVVCVFSVFACAASLVHAQASAQTDIYKHFIGTWVGTGVYMKDGVSHRIGVRVVVAENKKKDRLQLDYVYGQKGTADFDRETRFLKLNPTKSEFEIWWRGDSKETYKATGLDEFAKSGFGELTGITKNTDNPEQDRVARVILKLADGAFSYEWQHGPDASHLAFLSIYTLSRSTVTSQP